MSTLKDTAGNIISNTKRQACEIWTRVMGYHRPCSEFNKGKKSEFEARKCYDEAIAIKGMQKCDAEDKRNHIF